MVNKKIGIILALAALGLAGCGSTTSSASKAASTTSSGAATSVPGVDVPVVDGKYTLYFTFKANDEVSAIPAYDVPYFTGAATGWGTTAYAEGAETYALPFTALANSNVWYLQIDKTLFADVDGKFDMTKRGYQITLGWSSTSGAPASQQGIDWSYKNDYSALFPGTAHPKMDAPDTKGIVDLFGGTAVIADPDTAYTGDEGYVVDPAAKLDYLTFSATKAAPVQIKNRSIKFTIADKDKAGLARPGYVADFYATGSYQSWNGVLDEAHKLTAAADGSYTVALGDVWGDVKIEWMVVCTVKNSAGTVVTTSFWANKAAAANLAYTPVAVDGPDFTEDIGAITWEAWPTDPALAPVDVTLTVTLTDFVAGATYSAVGIKGSMDKDWSVLHEGVVSATDPTTYTISLSQLTAGAYTFKFVTYLTVDAGPVNWIGDSTGTDLPFTCSESAKAFAYTGTIAGGVALAA
jgi:hypothetical protein